MNLIPLLLIWMFSKRGAPLFASHDFMRTDPYAPPKWPTPSSPPPVPAFDAIRANPYAKTPLSADPSHSSTPLSELHNAPPEVPSVPEKIKAKAINAFQKKAATALSTHAADQRVREYAKKKAIAVPTKGRTLLQKSADQNVRKFAMRHALAVPTTGPTLQTKAASTVSVASLQKLLNARGAKLKQDGLYGPKTAAAWKSAAKSRGLADTIARVSSTTAKVVSHTYDSLSVPPVP